jgi:excisionase family DNA binding protein
MSIKGRNHSDGDQHPPKLARVPEAAHEMAVSTRTIWRLIAQRELEAVRVGRSVRVVRASIDRFVAKGSTN